MTIYSVQSPAEPGGPGTTFIYHQHHNHSTLLIDNNHRVSHHVGQVKNYLNLTTDSFKAWFLPDSGDHWIAKHNHDYRFDELQVYGNAHLAILPEPFEDGASLHFRHMIGDRSGVIHVGPNQVMDLRRHFIDTPFSSYVYEKGYLGLGHNTVMQQIFIHLEGTMDHITNLTLVHGAQLRLFQTGSTNNRTRLNYHINGTTIIKARSFINCSAPFAHPDQYNLQFNHITVEGGGEIKGKNMHISATTLSVDDGGVIEVNDGGYLAEQGRGKEHKGFFTLRSYTVNLII